MSQVAVSARAANARKTNAIEKKLLLRAPRSRVWAALTDLTQFCVWFGIDHAEGIFSAGERLRMVASKEAGGGEFEIFVEALETERLLVWRWHPGAYDPSVDYAAETTTQVTIKLAKAPDGTLVTITESGFDQISLARRRKVYDENRYGWDFQAKRLERYIDEKR